MMGLRIRLFVLVLIAVLPAIAIQFYTEFDLRRGREVEIRDAAMRHARLAASAMAEIVDGSRQLLIALAHLPAIQSLDSERCNEILVRLQRDLPAYNSIAAVDWNGRIICHGRADRTVAMPSVSDREYFREAKSTGDFVVGEFAISRLGGAKLLHLAYPITLEGMFVGVIVAGLDLDRLAMQFRKRSLPPGGDLTITDRNGTVLVRMPETADWVGRPLSGQSAAAWQSTERVVEAIGPDGVLRLYASTPMTYLPQGLVAMVGLDKDEALAPIEEATVRGIALILGGLGLGFGGAWLVGRRFVRQPIAALLDATRRWQDGDYTARANLPEQRSEIGQLGHAFDAMAERLQIQFRQKDMLLREVNHRIMNSLQLLSSVLSLQRRQIADPTAREQFDQARRRIQSMAMVHRRLYRRDLAETIDFGRFLNDFCTEIGRSLLPPDARVELSVEAGKVPLSSDKVIPLALIAFELVTNGIKHARPATGKGRLQIACNADEAALIILTIADNGPGLPPKSEDQTGLGMRLVDILVSQLRGTLSVTTGPSGTCFTVTVPGIQTVAVAA